MIERVLAGKKVKALGLGCMNLSHAYGIPPLPEDGARVLLRAFDLGADHFDTAALYGFGKSEALVGATLKPVRRQIFLASKCGLTNETGKRVVDGRPDTLKMTCDASLQRLQTDHIDLYYLHRWDKSVPIEESVGALGALVRAGKIGAVGLSEVSAATLKKAHAEHPIAAVQTEYSLWTRNAEIAVIEACRDIGAAFVAFSPLGRGFLAGAVRDLNFVDSDFRRSQPRMMADTFPHNYKLFLAFEALAHRHGIAPAQLALAWVLSRGDHIHAIPGTTSLAHLTEDLTQPDIDASVLAEADDMISEKTIQGHRYGPQGIAEVDTEEMMA